jgi:hypothetical protein
MALTELKIIDQITIIENGTIQYREVTRILKDGEQITQTYHRLSLAPASDLTDVPANVIAIANVVWTKDVIQAYKDRQNDNFNTKI